MNTFATSGFWTWASVFHSADRQMWWASLRSFSPYEGVPDGAERKGEGSKPEERPDFTWCWASSRFPLAQRESPSRWRIFASSSRRASCSASRRPVRGEGESGADESEQGRVKKKYSEQADSQVSSGGTDVSVAWHRCSDGEQVWMFGLGCNTLLTLRNAHTHTHKRVHIRQH